MLFSFGCCPFTGTIPSFGLRTAVAREHKFKDPQVPYKQGTAGTAFSTVAGNSGA